jgi:type II secretory pathway pseudopilin PulG
MLLALLATVLVLSLGATAAGTSALQQQRRERERALLRIGSLYAKALADYKKRSPGTLAATPKRVEELLSDTRFVGTLRHLRKLYDDPLRPGEPWELIRDLDGYVIGVHSQSNAEPLAESPTAPGLRVESGGRRYSDWKFLAAEIK